VRLDLSAFIDGELDPARVTEIEGHLAGCAACRNEERSLRAVRRLVRIQPVEDIPDLAPQIMARIRTDNVRVFQPWRERFRVAAVAAAAAALVVFGASLPFDRTPGDIAAAGDITAQVRAAARDLDGYRAAFTIVERGWHPAVPVRWMRAKITFHSPEDLRLEVEDLTDYPSAQWPPNDMTLVATSDSWWIHEPSSCPPAALPECASPTTWAGVTERRVVVNRQPFDGSSSLPTDIILPLETLASSESFDVGGTATIAGRTAYKLELAYRQAVPLVSALQTGGSWRAFHPLDEVELWIDAQTWFPLAFEVTAGTSPDRALWAARLDLDDDPGAVMLRVTATSFSEPKQLPSEVFDVPTRGLERDGGFTEDTTATPPAPAYRAGLVPYRFGHTAEGYELATYVDGMNYLKITSGARLVSASALQAAEEIRLPGGGVVYYHPATTTLGRRMDILGGSGVVSLQTNLPRAELIKIADSLPLTGRRVMESFTKGSGVSIRRLDPNRAFATFGFTTEPTYMPSGYEARSALRALTIDGVRSVTVYFRRAEAEFDGLGIRVVQSSTVAFLPPSSEEFVEVQIGDHRGRWSAERGELEWLDGTTYRSVVVPSTDLYTAVRIAESL
jgi:outer membrane lipoprotein-sorting protein